MPPRSNNGKPTAPPGGIIPPVPRQVPSIPPPLPPSGPVYEQKTGRARLAELIPEIQEGETRLAALQAAHASAHRLVHRLTNAGHGQAYFSEITSETRFTETGHADSGRLDSYAGCLGGGVQIIYSARHGRPAREPMPPAHNGGSTRASTVDRLRSVACWRTTVIAVEANDSLETWLTTGRPARSKRDTRAARRRRSEKGRGPGLEPCPRPAWPGRPGADLHPAGRLFEFGEADRQDPLLHGGLDLVGVDVPGQDRAVGEPHGPAGASGAPPALRGPSR